MVVVGFVVLDHRISCLITPNTDGTTVSGIQGAIVVRHGSFNSEAIGIPNHNPTCPNCSPCRRSLIVVCLHVTNINVFMRVADKRARAVSIDRYTREPLSWTVV